MSICTEKKFISLSISRPVLSQWRKTYILTNQQSSFSNVHFFPLHWIRFSPIKKSRILRSIKQKRSSERLCKTTRGKRRSTAREDGRRKKMDGVIKWTATDGERITVRVNSIFRRTVKSEMYKFKLYEFNESNEFLYVDFLYFSSIY